MHLKRQKVPKNWPVYRKGTKYLVRPNSDLKSGIPLLVILRDMLKLAQNRKEVRRAIFMKDILVNGKNARDEKMPLNLFDTISILPMKKSYRVDLSNTGRFDLKEISEKESERKPIKLVNKRILNGKMIQLNLLGGRNILSKEKCSINDSILVNFKENKIEKILPFKEGAKAIVFMGKHSGKIGYIKDIHKEKKTAELETEDKEKINALIKQLVIIE